MHPEALKNLVARAVLRAPTYHPRRSEEKVTDEVVFTVRPAGSGVGEYVKALPGGKIEKVDFLSFLPQAIIDNPEFTPTIHHLIEASRNAAIRELNEELGEQVALWAVGLLSFVNVSKNSAGWTTITYAADLERKPRLEVDPESAGTLWMDVRRILKGNPTLLSGHLGITRRALAHLDKLKS